ncbi:hypothetical protein SDC9_43796 [bioreactor metagenome]|uniref:Uncharacterized protein n=1 Tax=bioreactor metagenome TaxID=1076179 RepID=A0A644W1J3_9ZZZZ
MGTIFFYGIQRCLQVSRIIQGIKNPKNVDAVFDGFADKTIHDIIRIMAVPDQILSPKQHLQLCMRSTLADLPQSFPRIFMQKTDSRIIGCPAPAFERVISGLIHFLHNREHVLRRHACRHQTLMRIAQNGLSKKHFLSFFQSDHIHSFLWCQRYRNFL